MCSFHEPFVGQCKKQPDRLICEEHAKETCQVCGEQALTRCAASRGVMCGIPLCHQCGAGEMCLYHAWKGPLMAIKALLGAGPEPTIFSDFQCLGEEAEHMNKIVAKLRAMIFKPTMAEFEEALAKHRRNKQANK